MSRPRTPTRIPSPPTGGTSPTGIARGRRSSFWPTASPHTCRRVPTGRCASRGPHRRTPPNRSAAEARIGNRLPGSRSAAHHHAGSPRLPSGPCCRAARRFPSLSMVRPRHAETPHRGGRAACRRAALALVLVWGCGAGQTGAHDPSAWGGLFRSHDGGATWTHLTPASFSSGAMALAISPVDPHHLLLATDSGVSRSRNGGRDWDIEAPGILSGPAFAVAFDVDGERALLSNASAIFRTEGGEWRRLRTPPGSTPARALVSGAVRGRAYLVGRSGLHRTDDWGGTWVTIGGRFPTDHVRGPAVAPGRPGVSHARTGGACVNS